MKKNRFLLVLFFCLAAALCLSSYAAQDEIIAIVNKDVITQKDLDGFINFMRMQLAPDYQGEELEKKIASLESDLLERLIEDRLILQEAKKSGIQISSDKIKARINQIRRSYPSDNEFQAALKQQGLSQIDIETKIREQLLMYSIIELKIKSKIVINPNEVTGFYHQNKDALVTPEEREFQAITADSEEVARRVFSALQNKEDLAAVVKRYGVMASKLTAYGGGQLKKEVAETVFKLRTGEISRPVKINDKYCVFRLDGITPPRQQSLAEARDKIYNILLESKMQQGLNTWIAELKKQAYIKIFK